MLNLNKMLKIDAFRNFLLRLSKKERLLFYCAVFFVSLVLLDRLAINAILSKLRSLDEDAKRIQAGLKKDFRILAQRDRIAKLKNKYASYIAAVKSDDEEMVLFLKEIERLADKNSISLADLKPAGAGVEGDYKKYTINLNCEAPMEALINFIYSVENSDKLMSVEKYQLVPKTRNSDMAQCSITVSRIVIP